MNKTVYIDVLGGEATAEVKIQIETTPGFFGKLKPVVKIVLVCFHGSVAAADYNTAVNQVNARIADCLENL